MTSHDFICIYQNYTLPFHVQVNKLKVAYNKITIEQSQTTMQKNNHR